ncbi:MAG: T9SS type A sorting domain-containing protein [Chitinophagaceae bacterium]|nr:T9SS type A sorting domain-containing protein [Chitinophagaceae bacterium]
MKKHLRSTVLLFALVTGLTSSAQDARWGYQLSFDGTNDYFTANTVSAAVTGNSWTIEFWFRSSRTVTYTESILAFNPSDGTNRIEIGVGPSAGSKMYIYSPNSSPSTLYGSTAISTNTWYHVAVTFNSGTRAIQLYLNGSNTADVVRTLPAADVVQTTDKFSLGQEWDNATASGFFAGQLDEVRVWNSVRSNTQLVDNQYRQVATNSSGLLAYYKMTNNTGTTVTDNTGNGRNGTLVNGPAWQASAVTKNSNGTMPANQSINEDTQPADITISNYPYTGIQWQRSTDNNTWTNINTATAATLTGALMGTLSQTTYYRARLDNGYGTYDYSDVVTATVLTGTLPVHWLGFSARQQSQGILLSWSTATEEGSKRFDVEHSTNGSSWSRVATITAAGNSSTVQHYEALHANPASGSNYYRIRQIDADGKHNFSKVVFIAVAANHNAVLAYPNPVTNGVLYVKLEAAAGVRIVNMSGLTVVQKNLGAGLHNISVAHLPQGSYWVKAGDTAVKVLLR